MKKKSTKVKRAKKVSPYNKEFAKYWESIHADLREKVVNGYQNAEGSKSVYYDFFSTTTKTLFSSKEVDIYFPPDKPHVVKINGYSYVL